MPCPDTKAPQPAGNGETEPASSAATKTSPDGMKQVIGRQADENHPAEPVVVQEGLEAAAGGRGRGQDCVVVEGDYCGDAEAKVNSQPRGQGLAHPGEQAGG